MLITQEAPQMFRFLFFIFIFASLSFSQLKDQPKTSRDRINIYDQYPLMKKAREKLKNGESFTLTEADLQAIQLALKKHSKGANHASPLKEFITIAKISPEELYVRIGIKREYAIGGGFSAFVINTSTMKIIEEQLHQK